jgi:uncharacterized protein with HEPN domain
MSANGLLDYLGHMQQAATKVMDAHAEFTDAHPGIPWRSMRGMRNRIAHGYFDVNLEVVWETVQTALPELLSKFHEVRQDASQSS